MYADKIGGRVKEIYDKLVEEYTVVVKKRTDKVDRNDDKNNEKVEENKKDNDQSIGIISVDISECSEIVAV